jgi:hypothetical protein
VLPQLSLCLTSVSRHIANLTPLCGAVIAATVPQRFAGALKRFTQSHVAGEIFFSATAEGPVAPGWNNPTLYERTEYKFAMTFHLSYVVIRDGETRDGKTRDGKTRADPRRLRQSYSMIKPLDGDSDNLLYHDAQTSVLITGTSNRYWNAYCFIDTFFGSELSAEQYCAQQQDGPSGGARPENQPCWDPREYFLLVLSQRFRQTSREWGNFFTVLMYRLDAYVCISILIHLAIY